jgi:hypothetical protein
MSPFCKIPSECLETGDELRCQFCLLLPSQSTGKELKAWREAPDWQTRKAVHFKVNTGPGPPNASPYGSVTIFMSTEAPNHESMIHDSKALILAYSTVWSSFACPNHDVG